MRNTLLPFTLVLSLLPVGCFDSDDIPDGDETAAVDVRDGEVLPPPSSIPVGTRWGPCDLSGVNDDPEWWGCNGEPGDGLACARPVSDDALNICVPQTADPTVDDDCGNVTAPFGDGVRLQGSAYCVVSCLDDGDCAGGQRCASAGLCAWVG